jgi:hypothetical protein
MTSKEKTIMAMQDTVSVEGGAIEVLLRSEVGFWRELIDSCPEAHSSDSVERMNHALALAESRLADVLGSCKPISNVYHLDESRRQYK